MLWNRIYKNLTFSETLPSRDVVISVIHPSAVASVWVFLETSINSLCPMGNIWELNK